MRGVGVMVVPATAVGLYVCMSKCQEWGRLESKGQRQRQGIVSPAAGDIHLPHMCTFIFTFTSRNPS